MIKSIGIHRLPLVLTALITACNISAAQHVMGIRECMRYAVEHSPEMAIQSADNNDAHIDRRTAILSAFTPEISGQTYAYSNFGRSIDPETNTYKSLTSFHNGYSANAGIDLFNGFRAINNMKVTKTAIAMGLSKEQQTIDRICLAVMEAYCNAVYYENMMENVASQVRTAESSLELAERQEKLGQKSHADVVEMKASLADKEYQLTGVQNSYKDAMLTLRVLMMWPMDENFAIDNGFISQGPPVLTYAADTVGMIRHAASWNPSAAIAKGALEQARTRLRTAKWQTLPSLSLHGGWSTTFYTYPNDPGYTTTPYRSQFTANMGEYVQISMNIPIYSRLCRQASIKKSKNDLARAQASYDKAIKEVEAEVVRAVNDRDGAAKAYLQAERRLEVQKEAFHINTMKLEQGLISPIEFRTASDNYLNAQAERLNSILQFYLKDSIVKYYNGTPYMEQHH
ncbi:MAG: TolC family protein [Bacteroidales bacterium]|nr:TolC family protein [Bacteroidales bacterium]